ncbi:ATP synthase mitochondrial F1 complex assembly factor 2-like [Drosophila rhopaloa]|uniref:Uncharacterized protein n=1 Tax=Drosophila rhopaloa TaxID=1041015 RepID=A0ABM5JBQ6_DRORH|nr:ATP synthase mitochondrial F1 complex assembly factor 2-like [Drosophila rhopaloa]
MKLASCGWFVLVVRTPAFGVLFFPTAASPPKRFYKKTSVLSGDGGYEVVLDHRKLKTPKGTPFLVRSEPLAIAVATEFDAQKEHIERSRMHLSTLCFTAIDNPNHLSKLDMVNYLLNGALPVRRRDQLKFWGRVEWAHDLSQQELQSRLAAAVLFVHLNCSENFVKQKSIL